MPKAKFKCENCGAEIKVSFAVGASPKVPTCEACDREMRRDYGKVGLGENEPDDMTWVKQMMKNSQSFSGRDKNVF